MLDLKGRWLVLGDCPCKKPVVPLAALRVVGGSWDMLRSGLAAADMGSEVLVGDVQ